MINVRCRIKKNDKVRIITGKDKGKIGKVIKVIKKSERLVVENVNIVKKHTKPSAKNKQGGIIENEAPIHFSNVMLMCNVCIKSIRPKIKYLEDGKKVRICRKCNDIIKN